jgi:hypothetical protein
MTTDLEREAADLAGELFDRFVYGGWEAPEAVETVKCVLVIVQLRAEERMREKAAAILDEERNEHVSAMWAARAIRALPATVEEIP